jgi:hypothetical protein
MTTTQRPRPQRPPSPSTDPASRGLILVAVAVVLGVILLVKGGGVGFDRDGSDVQIGAGADSPAAEETTTTAPPPVTSVPPAELQIVALNAAGINGYAAQAQQFLGVAGYATVTPITAAAPAETTVVHFADGFEVDAMMVAQLFGLTDPAQVQPLPEDAQLARNPAEFPEGAQIAVLLGPDVSGTVQGADGGGAEAGGDTGDDTAGGDAGT